MERRFCEAILENIYFLVVFKRRTKIGDPKITTIRYGYMLVEAGTVQYILCMYAKLLLNNSLFLLKLTIQLVSIFEALECWICCC